MAGVVLPKVVYRCRKERLPAESRLTLAAQNFDHYLNELQVRRHARRWWAKAIAICAILGGVYGATVGVTIGAVRGAATIIGIAAAVLAFLCSGPGAWYGLIFSAVNRIRFGRYFVGMAAAIAGAIVGGFLATMLLMAFGAISGAVVGWLVARAIIRRSPSARLLGGLGGVVLGTFIGVVLWAVNLNQPKALIGLVWGLGVGAVVGPLLLLLFVGMLNRLPRVHVERRDYLDATFRRED